MTHLPHTTTAGRYQLALTLARDTAIERHDSLPIASVRPPVL